MSRAAEKPLPPPPTGSAWERINIAREHLGLSYGALSKAAGKKTGHFRTIATRGKWNADAATVDAFIEAVKSRGYNDTWLRAGVGPPGGGVEKSGRPSISDLLDEVRYLVETESASVQQAVEIVKDLALEGGDRISLHANAKVALNALRGRAHPLEVVRLDSEIPPDPRPPRGRGLKRR